MGFFDTFNNNFSNTIIPMAAKKQIADETAKRQLNLEMGKAALDSYLGSGDQTPLPIAQKHLEAAGLSPGTDLSMLKPSIKTQQVIKQAQSEEDFRNALNAMLEPKETLRGILLRGTGDVDRGFSTDGTLKEPLIPNAPDIPITQMVAPKVSAEDLVKLKLRLGGGSPSEDIKLLNALTSGDRAAQQEAMKEKFKWQTVPAGSSLVNPITGERIEGNPKEVDESVKMARYERIRTGLENQAYREAAKEAQLKFNLQPQLVQTPAGLQMSFPNHPDAHQFMLNRMSELKGRYIDKAIKRGALPEDYAIGEEPSKATVTPSGHPLIGKPPGQYKEKGTGKVINWDGEKEL